MAAHGYKKAALFLRGVGENVAAEIMKSLDIEDIKQITRHMEKMPIDQGEANDVIRETAGIIATGDLPGGKSYVRNIITKVLGEEAANTMLRSLNEENPIESIKEMETDLLSNRLALEHPQTVALTLCMIESTQAAEVLEALPEDMKDDIATRIAMLDNVPAAAITELKEALRGLNSESVTKKVEGGGTKRIADILNHINRGSEESILNSIEEQNKELADSIREKMFLFEDIIYVDSKGLQAVLKEVNNDDLSLALKTASIPLKEKVFKNMSKRAADILKEEMELKGPVRVSDVEAAQQSIIQVARRLEQDGQITIGGGGKDEMVA
jgi:flagellar motor switch protein FliG